MQGAAHSPSRYRADIDGLRALAILLVLLDHLSYRHFEGGYVGVDVFFVISGYLIGSSMLSDFREGIFSLADFYERRIRRIAPAFLVMLFVASLVAYHYLMPHSLMVFSRSMMAAIGSVSNVYYWRQAGYFDTQSSTKPLLHTWSLGVEEQFYLLSPLLLFLLVRWFPKRLLSILTALALFSFVCSVWVVRVNPTTAFFLLPFRAWELLLGLLISQCSARFLEVRWIRELSGLVGMGLIFYSGLFYTSVTPFPGLAALVPCLGCALLLAAGSVGPSVAGSILSLRVLRFIGLISYSLYLWHWPILVFQNTSMVVSTQVSAERWTKATLLALSLLAGTLSWWLIERPFRKGRLRPDRRALFVISGVSASCLLGFSVWILSCQGAPWRISQEVQRVAALEDYDATSALRTGVCFLDEANSPAEFRRDLCLSPDRSRRNILIYGDSTSAALYRGFTKTFPEIHFEQATAAACRPYRESNLGPLFRANCDAVYGYVHYDLLPHRRPDAVILAGTWSSDDLLPLGQEIVDLHRQGIQVIVMGPFMIFDRYLPSLIAGERRRHTPPDELRADLDRHLRFNGKALDAEMGMRARDQWHVGYISYFQDLCSQHPTSNGPLLETSDGCPLMVGEGTPLMFDNVHLTFEASLELAAAIRRSGQLEFGK